jgi:diaminohydroxyphosphoribosylaminopyrimidine deaminase / 5-amino-6-(5-phosphoribosylamino)uracil reductase
VNHEKFMRVALQLAARAYGNTSPNPLVGAVLVKRGEIIGRGFHKRAGERHAEIEALRDAARRGESPKGATLYVTLEPCCTHGRTPPCTEAIDAAGIKRVVVAATDPNPQHAGRGLKILRRAGVEVFAGVLAEEAARLNETFNHWIVHRNPFVTVKAAMSLDGKIATRTGESKWITSEKARGYAMHLRQGSDAILVGVNTVIADDPKLTVRKNGKRKAESGKALGRIILDSEGRIPLTANVISDERASATTIVVTKAASPKCLRDLRQRVNVWVAPTRRGRIDLRWVLRRLGDENVTSLLVEGGGEVNASFLFGGFAHRVAFFYAPKIIGGRDARKSVGGEGVASLDQAIQLNDVEWRWLGQDLLLLAKVAPRKST